MEFVRMIPSEKQKKTPEGVFFAFHSLLMAMSLCPHQVFHFHQVGNMIFHDVLETIENLAEITPFRRFAMGDKIIAKFYQP